MTTPLILLYNIEPGRRRQIEMLAALANIKTRAVSVGEYGKKIGTLCGIELEKERTPQGLWNDFSEEMMVMALFPQPLISQFLDSFRQVGIPSVRLKAVLTGVNMYWNSCQLRAELLREEAAFKERAAGKNQ